MTITKRMRSILAARMRVSAPNLFRHFSSFHRFDDRKLLERVILAYLRDSDAIERVLFVGCDWYTKPYERLFRSKEYWTLDVDERKKAYGARRHITDPLRNLGRHVPSGYFDAIVCNGVFMKTGMETWEEAEPSFLVCQDCMAVGAWFILGWNDTDELRPYPPSESRALRNLLRDPFPPLGVSEYLTDTTYRHTYTFYRKLRESRENEAPGSPSGATGRS